MLSCPHWRVLVCHHRSSTFCARCSLAATLVLSPGGESNLVLLKTYSPCASPVASHCLYSCCGLTKSPGLGWNCPRAWAVPIAFHSCSCSVCTWLGDTHDLGMAEPSHVCSCHQQTLVDVVRQPQNERDTELITFCFRKQVVLAI